MNTLLTKPSLGLTFTQMARVAKDLAVTHLGTSSFGQAQTIIAHPAL